MIEKTKIKQEYPNLIIVGNIAYDVIDFSKVDKTRTNIVEVGGACAFSAIPASLYYRTGMVGKIGNDFHISTLHNYNIDLRGIQSINMPTTRFNTVWNTIDGQNRVVTGKVDPKMDVRKQDIPKAFLGAKHFHLTTAKPEIQLEIIEFLRNYSNATISADTIDEFANDDKTLKVFDNVDIAFIDKEYDSLLQCKAPIKIIKCGKIGCIYYSEEKSFTVHSKVTKNVVDKTGAGDCLNGVFLSLFINGVREEKALHTAVQVATESVKQQGILNLKKLKIN